MENPAYITIKKGQYSTTIPSESYIDNDNEVFPVSPEVAILCVEINEMIKNKDIDIEEVKGWGKVKVGKLKGLINEKIQKWMRFDLQKQYDSSLDTSNERERYIIADVIILTTETWLRLKG